MRKFLIAASLLLPVAGFSTTINFKCHSIDIQGIHKFDAHGVVSVDDLDRVEGVISINTEKAQQTQSVLIFDEVRIDGFIRHFEDGQVGTPAFDQLVLNSSEPYIKSLNLMLNFQGKMSSKVMSIDNFTYRSNCKIN